MYILSGDVMTEEPCKGLRRTGSKFSGHLHMLGRRDIDFYYNL